MSVNNRVLPSLLIALVFHAAVLFLWFFFLPPDASPEYTEIRVVFEDDPIPEDPIEPESNEELQEPEREIVEEPEIPEIPEPSEPESITFQDEPEAAMQVQDPDSSPQQGEQAPPMVPTPPNSSPRQPSREEILGDVADLLQSRNPDSATPPSQQEELNRTGLQERFLTTPSSQENSNSVLQNSEAQEWQRDNQVQQRPEQSTESPASQQDRQPTVPTTDIKADIARLQAELQQQYRESQTTSSAAPQSPGQIITDPRLQGPISGVRRSLVRQDRLDLKPYLGDTREASWPATITVKFEVNKNGMVNLLNGDDLSRYDTIYQAVLRLFNEGPVFVPAPQSPRQEGSITYELR